MAKRQDYDYLIKLLLIGDSGKDRQRALQGDWSRGGAQAGLNEPLLLALPLQAWARAACCSALRRTASPRASSPPSGKAVRGTGGRRRGGCRPALALPPS